MTRIEEQLEAWLQAGATAMGEVGWTVHAGGWRLYHRDDDPEASELQELRGAEAATELARFDDAGEYRPLKTAPTLRHGWRLQLESLRELRLALDAFYPGALGLAAAAERGALEVTPVRETLNRQTGMFRVTGLITGEDLQSLVGEKCRSSDGCLRRILWDLGPDEPALDFPPEKFVPDADPLDRGAHVIPLLCREFCNLMVGQARTVVKRAQAQAAS